MFVFDFSFFFFKQKTVYEIRISDWSSDVCSSDLVVLDAAGRRREVAVRAGGAQDQQVDAGRLDAGLLDRLPPRLGRQARRRAPVAALLDAGALGDPGVAGVEVGLEVGVGQDLVGQGGDRKSTRLNSGH